jgi:hypothetical protein
VLTVPGALAFGAYGAAALIGLAVASLWRRQWAWAAVGLMLAPMALVLEYQHRIDALSARYTDGGAQALSTRDRVAVYALNLEMAIAGAALGYPEAAAETALMAFGRTRAIDASGSFLLADPKIRRVLKSALADPRTTITLPAPRWRYDPATESLRVGLAVNGARRLTIVWRDEGDETFADVTLPIRITYPAQGKLVLADNVLGRPLAIDEGLFHALEEVGWLSSYEVRWHATIAVAALE